MPAPAYERHLDRAQARIALWMQECARGLAGELVRQPAAEIAQRLLRGEVADALARHHPVLANGFRDALQRPLHEHTGATSGRRARGQDLAELEIMDDARVQEEIEVAHVVQVLGADAGHELHRLLRFETALRRSEGVRVSSSPVGPPALARALWQGSERLHLAMPGRVEAVRAAARWMGPRLGAVYVELLEAGDADAVQALAVADGPEPLEADSEFMPPSGFDVTRPGALLDLLEAGDIAPSEASTFAALAETQPMPLDGDDLRIPELIHSHRDELAALQGQGQGRTGPVLNLITRLFDQILADPALPAEARQWIGRLQPSVVRLASADASLLESHRHPAWTFVNRLATQMSGGDAPTAPEFLHWLAATVAQIAARPDSAAFEDACQRLAEWRRTQAHRRLTDVQAALELLRRNASLEAQVGIARTRLQRRLDSAQPATVTSRFVLTMWSLVCAQQASTKEPRLPGVADAWDVASDLIWSTDAARSLADSPTLLAMMPVLVQQLTQGMAGVGVAAEHRDAWLAQLAQLHVKALQRPAGAQADGGPLTVDLKLDETFDADDEPDTAPMQYEPAEDLAPALAPAPAPRPAGDLVADLQVGDGVGLLLAGEWVDVQLLWTSENGQFLLFANERSGRSHSFTRRALQMMLKGGLLRSLEARSALERATDEIARRRG